METTIDAVGRIVVPKPLRDALGLAPGSTVDISRYGAGLQLVPTGRTARLVDESGVLVATGETAIDDDVVFALMDSGRRSSRSHSTPAWPSHCLVQTHVAHDEVGASGRCRRDEAGDQAPQSLDEELFVQRGIGNGDVHHLVERVMDTITSPAFGSAART